MEKGLRTKGKRGWSMFLRLKRTDKDVILLSWVKSANTVQNNILGS